MDIHRQLAGGLGVEQHIDEDLVIPDKETTLRKGAIAPWAKSSSPYYIQTLTALGKFYKFTLDTKWKDLPKKTQAALLHGSGDDEIHGGAGRDSFSGGSGDDVIYARGSEKENIKCGSGDDVVFADNKDKVAKDCETVNRP